MTRSGAGGRAAVQPTWASVGSRAAAMLVKAPVQVYRWTLKPFVGWQCRHLPTCSEYALEAIDRNGAWRGFWLATSRLCRCHPWGTAGFDPVQDIRAEWHPLTPWRYGRWTGRHMTQHWRATAPGADRLGKYD
jgi:putative membrane protein insertion efficiency factor